jgi:hypothetical protein
MRFVVLALSVALAGPAAAQYTLEQARTTAEEHVRRSAEETGGVYRLPDGAAGRTLELEFIQVGVVAAGSMWTIHDPERRVGADAFLACARFHGAGQPAGKDYDVDFLIEPREGGLVVTDVRVHKERRLVAGEWVWETRKAVTAGAAAGR